MATSPIYNWPEPDNGDLVKNGALAIRTLGNAIDTTMGTMTPKSIVDAKGDLIAASSNDTPARLAVGANGEYLVADSTTATGLRWQGDFAAGKNKFLNGDFSVNQRNFVSSTTSGTYGFDRWFTESTGGTVTSSAQPFTAGTAPVAGYEGTNFLRVLTASQSAVNNYAAFDQRIENVRTFAGQTITLSFWAKAASGTPKVSVEMIQDFGSGGSSRVNTAASAATTISTSWARYSVTIAIPSISGKTVGTSSYLELFLWVSAGTNFTSRTNSIGLQNNTFDFWGLQIEAGSIATPFQTATGTVQGELAACQRYFELVAYAAGSPSGVTVPAIVYTSSVAAIGFIQYQPKRSTPTITTPTTTMRFISNLGVNTGQTPAFSGMTVNAAAIATTATFLTSYGFLDTIGNVSISSEL